MSSGSVGGFFGNQNKKRKLKRLQREQQRSKAKQAKAAKARKRRERRERGEAEDDQGTAPADDQGTPPADDAKMLTESASGVVPENDEERVSHAIDSAPTRIGESGKEKLSKRKKKMLEKLEEKKQKKARRAALFESLAASRIPTDQKKLFVPSSRMGQGETQKETLTRDLYFERAGLAALRQAEEVEKQDAKASAFVDEEQLMSKKKSRQVARKRRKLAKKAAKDAALAEAEQRRAEALANDSLSGSSSDDDDLGPANDEALGGSPTTEQGDASAVPEEVKLTRHQRNLDQKRMAQIEEDAHELTANANASGGAATKSYGSTEKAYVVHVDRDPKIQKERMQLPVCGMEQELMEAIAGHSFVVLCGETGSGKTTQLPQFLYEAGYGDKDSPNPGMIAVTQPRRVAAVTMASRIAAELNVTWGRDGTVAHQIRYDARTVGEKTRLKLMTDGVLLREIRSDFLLRKYSVVIVDEAHERGLNTDLLIGLLSRIVPLRKKMARESGRSPTADRICPLKVIIMSATLNVKDFSENHSLFPVHNSAIQRPIVMKVKARRYPITVHFNKRTPTDDYIDATFRKVCKIHNTLPRGGILVFLTGKREILDFCRQLRDRYAGAGGISSPGGAAAAKEQSAAPEVELGVEDGDRDLAEESDGSVSDSDGAEIEAGKDGDWELDKDGDFEEEDEVVVLNAEEDEKGEGGGKAEAEDSNLPKIVLVLPLYAMLPQHEQLHVFEDAPEDTRVIVVSTNVAETSITIPGIRYVVDAGREKCRNYDRRTGASSFDVEWISQSSATQRAGRCGRTGPGHCYRLYSSAMYNDHFEEQTMPEILKRPIDDLILNMKAMYIERVQKFPFPTAPSQSDMTKAMSTLLCLGALKSVGDGIVGPAEEQITDLGKKMALFPVTPRFAKMLLLGCQQNLLPYAVALVSALSAQAPYLNNDGVQKDKEEASDDQTVGSARRNWRHTESDALALLRVVGAYSHATDCTNRSRHVKQKQVAQKFCKEFELNGRIMGEIQKLRKQLKGIVARSGASGSGINVGMSSRSLKLPPPTPSQEALLLQLVGAGFIDRVARLSPEGTWPIPEDVLEDPRAARQYRRRIKCAYQSCDLSLASKPLWIHPTSSVAAKDFRRLPRYIVYKEIIETSRSYMVCVTAIKEQHIAALSKGTPLCSFSLPMDAPLPYYDKQTDTVRGTSKPFFGPHRWCLTPSTVPISETTNVHGKGGATTTDVHELETRWFIRLLLEGKVVEPAGFQRLTSALKNSPSIITHSRFNPFGLQITQDFSLAGVKSLASLRRGLQQNPNAFLPTFHKFAAHKPDVREAWDLCKGAILNLA